MGTDRPSETTIPLPEPSGIDRAAREALARGYTPIPLRPGTKRPVMSNWQTIRHVDERSMESEFIASREVTGEGVNVGVALGTASDGLVDVDLDHTLALAAAKHFLPATPARSGRLTSPSSHWWYRVTEDAPAKTEQYLLPPVKGDDGKTVRGEVIVELRSTGGQTVIPPSVHPDTGETYQWVGPPFGGSEGPAEMPGRLLRARVLLIALTVTLADAWPRTGGRHSAYLALAGTLLFERGPGGDGDVRVNAVWERHGENVLAAVADLTHDEEGAVARVEESFPSTLDRLRGGRPAQGYPTLVECIGEPAAYSARRLVHEIEATLGYVRSGRDTSPEPSAAISGTTTLSVVPDYPEDADDAERPQEPPILLDLSDAIVQQEIRAQVHRLQLQHEAKRRYSAAKMGGPAKINLQPLAVVAEVEPDPAPRIENFLPWEGGTLLVAQAKTGKTTMCLNMAKSLLTGAPFLGRFEVRPVEGERKVALLNFEMSPAQMADWCLRVDIPRDRFLLLNQKGEGNPFATEESKAELAEALREWDVETLIVDTFAAVYVGESQNDANEVRPWLEDLLTWSKSAGVQDLVLTAHAGHTDGRVRGSTALMDWADMTVFLTCEDATNRNAPRYVHTAGRIDGLSKVRYSHDEVSLTQSLMDDATVAASTSVELDPGPLADARDALISTFRESDGAPMTATELDKRVQLRSGCSRETARSARYEGVQYGYIVTDDGARNAKVHRLADDWERAWREAFPEEV